MIPETEMKDQPQLHSSLSGKTYDFDLRRDRRFSSIIFSHLARINNYPKNREQINQMYDSKYESVRRIASFIEYPPISDGQIESLRHENSTQNSRQYIDQKAPLWGALLTNIIHGFKPTNVLEIGTFTGITSCYLAKRNVKAQVDTLDIDSKMVEVANRNFTALDLVNVKAYHSDYREWDLSKYDAIFKDGLHKGQSNLDLIDEVSKDGKPKLVVLDDIRWSWDMLSAWNKLTKHDKVSASIDCYHIGALLINLPERLNNVQESYKYSLPGLLPR